MEYARSRRKRRVGRGRHNRGGGELGRAILALLMIAAIVYLVSASTAGTWIAKNVVVPVFSMIDDFKSIKENAPAESEAKDADAGADMQVSLNDTSQAVEMEVTLPSLTCYALQMGVYSSAANAQAQSLTLQGSGAGGYIMQDGDRYRVFSAGFSDQAQAASAKAQYVGQGVDCTVYTFATNEATYRVNALKEQQASIVAGFSSIANAQSALCNLSSQYDASTVDWQSGVEKLRQIGETLKSDISFLSNYEGDKNALTDLLSCYKDCLSAIENAANANAQSAAAFAANIKYAQLYVTDQYAQLMASLGYTGSTPSAAS